MLKSIAALGERLWDQTNTKLLQRKSVEHIQVVSEHNQFKLVRV